MASYYAVERSGEYLAHYGVKGMQWGVRKAREKKDSKRLDRVYRRAVKKARKLNTKADISRSAQEYKGRMEDAKVMGLTGAVTAGGPLAIRALSRKWNMRTKAAGVAGIVPFYYDSETAPNYAAPIGGAMLGYGAYHLGKGLAAKHRTTPKGHAKAVAKSQNWKSEMKRAFKGTKYASLPGANKLNPGYAYEGAKDQFKNAALNAAVYPGYAQYRKELKAAKKKRK